MAKRLVYVAGVLALLLVLLPRSVHAVAPAQPVSCVSEVAAVLKRWPVLRRLIEGTTGIELGRVREGRANVGARVVTGKLCAERQYDQDADRALDLVLRALPRLSAQTGVPFARDTVLVFYGVPSVSDADNQEADAPWVIKLGPGSTSWEIIRETARYWGTTQLGDEREPWLAEAYAQYLTASLAKDLDAYESAVALDQRCAGRPLLSWKPTSSSAGECAAATGGALFTQLAERVGQERLRATVTEISTRYRGTASPTRLLLDKLEGDQVGTLDDLFRERVFPGDQSGLLDLRRAVYQRLARAEALAARLQLGWPDGPLNAARDWDFGTATAILDQLEPVLGRIETVRTQCAQAGLSGCAGLNSAALAVGSAELTAALDRAEPLLAQYRTVRAAAARQQLELPDPVTAAVDRAALDASNTLTRAESLLTQLDEVRRACEAVELRCPDLWLTDWRRAQFEPAKATLNDLGQLVSRYTGLERRRCTLYQSECRTAWQPALTEGLTTAGAALDTLEQLLPLAATVEQRCVPDHAVCRALWIAPFRTGDLAGAAAVLTALGDQAQQVQLLAARCTSLSANCHQIWTQALRAGLDSGKTALVTLNALIERGLAQEQACREAEWPCEDGWRGWLKLGDLTQVTAQLDDTAQALTPLSSDAVALRTPSRLAHLLISPAEAEQRIQTAQQQFAAGKVAAASKTIGTVKAAQRASIGLSIGLPLLALGLLGVVVVRRWRHRRTKKPILIDRPGQRAGAAAPPPTKPTPPKPPANEPPSTPAPPEEDLLAALLRQHRNHTKQ